MLAIPIITLIVIAFAIFYKVTTSRKSKDYGKDFEDFINGELEANAVKSRPIGDEDIFTPDMSLFPVKADGGGDEPLLRKQREVLKRAQKKMMRFDAPMSNTELKRKYGTVNLEIVTEYEENFYQFTYAVNNWAEALLEAGDEAAAEQVLRGGVKCGAETSKTYTMLADIYFKSNRRADMSELYIIVKNKNMPAKEKTWLHINEYINKMGL